MKTLKIKVGMKCYNIFVRILTSIDSFGIMAKLPTRQLVKFRPVNSFPIKGIFWLSQVRRQFHNHTLDNLDHTAL